MKKIISICCLLLLAGSMVAQTAAFKRSNTNLPFAADMTSGQVFNIDRGGGLPPANITASNVAKVVRKEQQLAGPWTMIVIPDTQYFANGSAGGAQAMSDLVTWITNNVSALNIKLVINEGDIVENYSQAPEWLMMSNHYYQIGLRVPLVLVNGNHDLDYAGVRSLTNYNNYFPTTFFSQWGTQFKDAGKTENQFLLQTNNGVPWLFLALEFSPRDATLTWVDSVLSAYSNHNAVITTHAFTHPDGTLERSNSEYTQTGYLSDGRNSIYTWTNNLTHHKNLRMVLNGHYLVGNMTTPAIANVVKVGDWGNKVYLMCFNYQQVAQNQTNANFIRPIRFDESSSKALVRTYNPSRNIYDSSPRNEFSLDWTAGSFPEKIPDNLRVVSDAESLTTLQAGSTLWTLRVTSTNSGLELWSGPNEAVSSNSFRFRFETNGTISGLASTNYIAATNAPSVVTLPTPLLYFPFDEGAGFAASSGTYTATNAIDNLWDAGWSGSAFYNVDPWGYYLTNYSAYSGIQNFTLAAWCKPASISAQASYIVTKLNSGTSGDWSLGLLNATTIRFGTVPDSGSRDDQDTTVPNVLGRWHHIAATYDGAQKITYLDGVPVKTNAWAQTIKTSTEPILIGNVGLGLGGGGYAFNGLIDEVRIYTNALSAAQVSALYGENWHVPNLAVGAWIPSNTPSLWPRRPRYAGDAYSVNSNGTIYMLTSTASTAWAATNKIAP
jgi:hypothetical protein